MSLHRFHCPGLSEGINNLPSEEAHHAASVLRMTQGQALELFDGQGKAARGTIERITRREVEVRVEPVRSIPFEFRYRLTLAVAMSKAHRQGYLVEKCTELGVAAIWPIIAERSVTKPGEAAVEKWSRRAVEAAKQSGRAWVPEIAPVAPFVDALARAGEFPLALFCDLTTDAKPIQSAIGNWQSEVPKIANRQSATHPAASPIANRQSKIDNSLIAFVGPEGGWTDDERRAARDAGLTSVTLSPTILRAETAAVALCAFVATQQ